MRSPCTDKWRGSGRRSPTHSGQVGGRHGQDDVWIESRHPLGMGAAAVGRLGLVSRSPPRPPLRAAREVRQTEPEVGARPAPAESSRRAPRARWPVFRSRSVPGRRGRSSAVDPPCGRTHRAASRPRCRAPQASELRHSRRQHLRGQRRMVFLRGTARKLGARVVPLDPRLAPTARGGRAPPKNEGGTGGRPLLLASWLVAR